MLRNLRFLLLLILTTLLSACLRDAPLRATEMTAQGAYSASLSSNGQFAAIGSIRHGGSLWHTADAERLFSWNLAAGSFSDIISTALSADGRIALTADTRQVGFWSTDTGESVGFWAAPADISVTVLSGDGRFALIGLKDYSAIFIDVFAGNVVHRLSHQGVIKSVSLSENGELALTGSDDRSAKLWDLNTGKSIHQWPHSNTVNMVKLSDDGRHAITSSQHAGLFLWNTQTGLQTQTFANRSLTFTSAAFSRNNRQILLGTSLQTIQLRETATAKLVKQWRIAGKKPWQPSNSKVIAVAFSESNKIFYSITANGLLQKWPLQP